MADNTTTTTGTEEDYSSPDWFDLDKYKQAAGVAYEFSKKKLEDAAAQERLSRAQAQQFAEKDEERDRRQAQQAYRY